MFVGRRGRVGGGDEASLEPIILVLRRKLRLTPSPLTSERTSGLFTFHGFRLLRALSLTHQKRLLPYRVRARYIHLSVSAVCDCFICNRPITRDIFCGTWDPAGKSNKIAVLELMCTTVKGNQVCLSYKK